MQEQITEIYLTVLDTDSVSLDVVDLVGCAIVGFEMPAALDAAVLITFQAAGEPGGGLLNMYTQAGAELTVTVDVDRHIPVDPTDFASVRFLAVRLGTAAIPVVATGDRLIGVIVRPIA